METSFVRTEFDIAGKKKKLEKLAATTKSWKWAAVQKKSGKEHFFYKTCNWEVSGSFT